VPVAGWALAAATFWFICSTMLVWSFSAALATRAGIADRTIGQAVAIGSVVGALTAVAVMRERLLVPLPVTALLSGLALASPVVLTVPGRTAPMSRRSCCSTSVPPRSSSDARGWRRRRAGICAFACSWPARTVLG
jgi:hypothetical protein